MTEWEGRERSSVSILSWRDSRPKVWSTSSRLSSLPVSRELASSLTLYVPLSLRLCSLSSPLILLSSLFDTVLIKKAPYHYAKPVFLHPQNNCSPSISLHVLILYHNSRHLLSSPHRISMPTATRFWLILSTVMTTMPISRTLFETIIIQTMKNVKLYTRLLACIFFCFIFNFVCYY